MKHLRLVRGTIFSLCALVVMGAQNAHAVLTAEQLAVTASIDTMITDMTSWAWTAVLAVLGATIAIKIFKKFAYRAT
ncbi:hypothetical protein KAR91_83075 [Candidatus Pacearchaeota archaeon]|nr:hypothetical protein [Candidatus Pacearchaeota archaeon]